MVLKVGRFFTHYRLQYFRNCPNPILCPMSPTGASFLWERRSITSSSLLQRILWLWRSQACMLVPSPQESHQQRDATKKNSLSWNRSLWHLQLIDLVPLNLSSRVRGLLFCRSRWNSMRGANVTPLFVDTDCLSHRRRKKQLEINIMLDSWRVLLSDPHDNAHVPQHSCHIWLAGGSTSRFLKTRPSTKTLNFLPCS